MYDYVIVGGGIVGLSTALAIYELHPNAKVAIIEKENKVASHQTGHNSGVIHSGIYYKPGSYKAQLAKKGNQAMIMFCQKYDIPYEVCGKVIVASDEHEREELEKLFQRGLKNGLNIRKISKEELHEFEPYVNGIEAIHVPSTGIVNFRLVSERMADLILEKGGEIFLNEKVEVIHEKKQEVIVETANKTFQSRFFINCAGLNSDRIAKIANLYTDVKIVPFRGEYYMLNPQKSYLVKNLIYPVPNPNFPFLGVHFTRMIDGSIDIGPNAVLSLKREGYKKSDANMKDLFEVLTFPGFWKLAGQYMKEGLEEMIRSMSKKKFVENVQKLMPDITEEDLLPGPSGVRAQALSKDGALIDDFYIVPTKRSIHVLNAPSPAATASIEIGRTIAKQMIQRQPI
ncbi:MAG: L-2-hydroxyglutarate oxidase [Bacillaceae bacterium]|uniref:L-2-hydroxyglutarate oxidase n=1 Tax=Aeribacillus composti TaxID=1868734 RepID=A0ABY9WAW0_9BACI|nr:L-2-hydroxyglutarate oxidase [Aeribacillus composti]REJ12885.1 MAG: L-2-hydroxyglutarate oxidase [Bacillaceae bacterium]WNF33183.1 L-2-hydroxyglutarate oxidase [Aeribacillus composti]